MNDTGYVLIVMALYAAFIIVLITFTRRIGKKLDRIAGNTGALPGIRDRLLGLNERIDTTVQNMPPNEPPLWRPPDGSGGGGTAARDDWGVFDWEGDWMDHRVSEEQARVTFAANVKRAWTLVKNIRFDGTTGEETYTVVERRESLFSSHAPPLMRTR